MGVLNEKRCKMSSDAEAINANPRACGKISSTRKRVMQIRRSYRKHRRNGSRKNKRYTKKNKNYL